MDQPPRGTVLAWSALVFVVALVPRMCNYAGTFVQGEVIFGGVDAYYHMRRIELALSNHLLLPATDTYLNYPRETLVDWPPGFDTAMAAICMVVQPVLPASVSPGAVCAMVIPLLGALTCALVVVVASRRAGLQAGVLGGLLLAGVACHVDYSTVGRVDHHVVEPLLLLAAMVTYGWARRRGGPFRHAGLGLVLALLPAFWPGAIVFSVPVVLAFGIELWRGARDHLGLWTFGAALLTSVLLSLSSPWGRQGEVVYYALSWFQPLSFAAAITAVGAGVALASLGRRSPRMAWWLVAGGALLAGAVAVAVPPLRETLARAAGYLLTTEAQISVVHESRPPLSHGFGYLLAWYTPLVLLWPVAVVRGLRKGASVPPVWIAALLVAGTLAMIQGRFGVFAAVPASLVLGEGLVAAGRWLRRRLAPRATRPVPMTAALIVVIVVVSIGVSVRPFLSFKANVLPLLPQGYEALVWLRDEAPPTSHFDEPWAGTPEYGVLSTWAWGHWITYLSHKPNVANPLGQTTQNLEGLEDAARILLAMTEDDAVEFATSRGIRYALLVPLAADLRSLVNQTELDFEELVEVDPASGDLVRTRAPFHGTLHSRAYLYDGVAMALGEDNMVPALRHVRLCYESSNTTVTHGTERSYARVVEFVPGAIVSGRCDAGAVELQGEVATNRERRFEYARRVPTGEQGGFQLVVPYAHRGGPGTTGLEDPFVLRCGERQVLVSIEEGQVVGGQVIDVGDVSPADGEAPGISDR